MDKEDVIIIGAGAAGLMCAIEAGKRGRGVTLLDHAVSIGKKILISGGGRCNFTNREISADQYISQNPHFCRSALSRYTADDFISLVEKHKIAYHEKKLGQLFCDGSARQILKMLKDECESANVTILPNIKIVSVAKGANEFEIKTEKETYFSESLVIATGGLSIPQIGATDFGYQLAQQFGLKIVPPSPALDGFVFDQKALHEWEGLSGVSLEVILSINGISFRENILFTHKGLSGPAALQGSLYWKQGDTIKINLIPDIEIDEWLASLHESRSLMKNLLLKFFPERFARRFCELYLVHSGPLNQMKKKERVAFAKKLSSWEITPSGTVGYNKAEVTRGGVSTHELSSKTFESKKVSNLYFIGEVVDVTGWLGGYNFQWAWSSGWAAGQSA